MKILKYILAAAILGGVTSARAQDTVSQQEHKPGGVNKVARDVSKTFKKAGRDSKAELKRTSSRTHTVLTKAGKDTKAELKRTTGITSKSPSATHKPGGLNKLARDVSSTSKKAGSDAKHELKDAKSDAHRASTKAGKDVKAEAKRTVP
jgi:hypothetical protein